MGCGGCFGVALLTAILFSGPPLKKHLDPIPDWVVITVLCSPLILFGLFLLICDLLWRRRPPDEPSERLPDHLRRTREPLDLYGGPEDNPARDGEPGTGSED